MDSLSGGEMVGGRQDPAEKNKAEGREAINRNHPEQRSSDGREKGHYVENMTKKSSISIGKRRMTAR